MKRPVVAAVLVSLLSVLLPFAASGATQSSTLIDAGSRWKYSTNAPSPGTGWTSPGYEDASWPSGRAQLGFGDGDEATELEAGSRTYYFRKHFDVADVDNIEGLTLATLVDDGAVVYLNGSEIWRSSNIPIGQVHSTLATTYVAGAGERAWNDVSLPSGNLAEGDNVIAVEVHQHSDWSSDLSFDLSLQATEGVTEGVTAPEPPETGEPRTMCRISDSRLPEISGMAASVRHPGILWVHNDSGDSARIFALDSKTCAVRAIVRLNGVSAYDFEAMSIGRTRSGAPEIWVGDIGDNSWSRRNIKLHRFREPASLENTTTDVKTVKVTWSDGARDAESVMVEPVPEGRVFIVSKESQGGVYRLRGDFRSTGQATTGMRVQSTRGWASDSAISPDRSRTVIRAYNRATLLTGVPGSNPQSFDLPWQPQGEAITFSLDGQSLFIASEGKSDLIRLPATAN